MSYSELENNKKNVLFEPLFPSLSIFFGYFTKNKVLVFSVICHLVIL